ncbi:MAG: ABC transporter ATP-binding protein, partial [Chlamydiae bacterium]|nr:ABC transporter ATP-binding protein [Chlamydiota bacterium]
LDAIDNIKISLIYSNRSKAYNSSLVEEILNFAELEDQRNVPLYQYSSGMLARLAFSINIFQKGDILITDEIFATGDAKFINKSRQKMKDLWDNVDIAINVSHDIEDIRILCNFCYVMKRGEIVYSGSTSDAIDYYDKIYIHNPNAHR